MEKKIIDSSIHLEPTVVVLGNFDGVHLGHQLLLDKAEEIAREEKLKKAIFTFNPHPSFVLSGREPVDMILTIEEKERIMAEKGIDYYLEFPFSKETALMSPEAFITDILINRLQAKVIVIGADYRFGHKRAGDYKMLIAYSENHDFDVIVVHKLKQDHLDISSSWIREALKSGNMEKAAALMGRPFSFTGEVLHGRQIGHKIGCPTANLKPDPSKVLPPLGVYASGAWIDGVYFRAVTSVGKNPTIAEGQSVTVETHVLDFSGDLYGKIITVELLKHLRPEAKFDSLDALIFQIKDDIETTHLYFER